MVRDTESVLHTGLKVSGPPFRMTSCRGFSMLLVKSVKSEHIYHSKNKLDDYCGLKNSKSCGTLKDRCHIIGVRAGSS